MSRIIFLSQLFDPEPTAKGLNFVAELIRRGIQVKVVTGFPNYPGGKVYAGYHMRWRQDDVMAGIEVTRLATYPSHDKSAVRRIISYGSFFLTSLFHLLFRAKRADLIYVYYPTLTAGLSAVAARLFRRTPIVLDIQDMWPDSLGASGMMTNRYLLGFAHFLCGLLYRNCAHIIVQSPGFRRLLIDRGVPEQKITVIYNWVDNPSVAAQAPVQTALPAGFDPGDGQRFLFAGNMGTAQGLSAVLDAAALVQRTRPDIRFYFMGGGPEQKNLEQKTAELGLDNVRFLPRVPMAEIQAYLAAADCLIVHLKDEPLFRVTIPSKTQAYLAAGRPILMAAPGDAADLVVAAGAGLAAMPEDPMDLAAKALQIAQLSPQDRREMGQRGRTYYQSHLSIDQGLAATLKVIQQGVDSRFRPKA